VGWSSDYDFPYSLEKIDYELSPEEQSLIQTQLPESPSPTVHFLKKLTDIRLEQIDVPPSPPPPLVPSLLFPIV